MISFLIKDTTREERQAYVNDALAISLLGADYPTPETMELSKLYIDGIMEIEDIKKIIIDKYTPKI